VGKDGNDGVLDLCAMNGDDNTSISTINQRFRNPGKENAGLTVKVVGTVSNREAVGAKVRALAVLDTGGHRHQRNRHADLQGHGRRPLRWTVLPGGMSFLKAITSGASASVRAAPACVTNRPRPG
jgi:hypothetical protein